MIMLILWVFLLFYDCNIKSCEVYLRSNLLGFSNCVDCVDKKANQKEYETLKLKNDMFQIYKDIIYSYWNNIKKQQSIDETWDIEDHLQEVTTYSNALKQIKLTIWQKKFLKIVWHLYPKYKL